MPVKTGKRGVVDGVSSVRNWTINDANTLNPVKASNTGAGTTRSDGVEDWTGSFVHLGGSPIVLPGDAFAFDGFTGSNDGTKLGTGEIWSGDAVVVDIAVAWDWTTNALINTTVNFGGNGALAVTTGNLQDGTNPPTSQYPRTRTIKFGALGDTFAAVLAGSSKFPNIANATLTVTNAVQTHVDSDTGGWTGRIGGPIDWNMSLTLNNITRSELPTKNQIMTIVAQVTDTLYWGLKWGKVVDVTGITVDNDSGAIITATVNVEMYGADETAGLGQIQLPGEVTPWWPAAA